MMLPILDVLLARFRELTDWLETANGALPNHVTAGFTVSCVVAVVLWLPILYAVFRMIWVRAEVGPARKVMTSFFVLILGVPLYPVLCALLFALFWLAIGFGTLTLACFGPAALGFWLMTLLWNWMEDDVSEQRKKWRRMQRRNQGVEDITCWELICGLFIGILSCCTFGMVALVFTILKSPLVILSFVLRFVYESLCRWLVLVHSDWRPWCSCCATSRTLEFRPDETASIQDLSSQGYSAGDLALLGATVGDLYAAGFTIKQLRDEPGFRYRDFQDAGLEVEFSWHGVGGYCWWWWFPLVFLTWLSVLAGLVCMLVVLILLVSLTKLIVAVIWPAYIAAGWLRVLAQARRRPSQRDCCQPLIGGLAAGYQVVWVSAMLTNICILNRNMFTKWQLVIQTMEELGEYAKGDRAELSPNLRSLSLFPPTLVGLFSDDWDIRLRTLARRLEVSQDTVQEAWRSLARQMIRLGRAAIDDGLITQEWVDEVPGELCIGLPARVFLDAVERSPKGELLLAGGLSVTRDKVPKLGDFGQKFWDHFWEAHTARHAVRLDGAVHQLLCAALPAGGGDPDSIPSGLSKAVARYESLPEETYVACQAILRPLVALALECGRQREFKEKLELVIESMGHVNAEELTQQLFESHRCDEDGSPTSSSGSESA